jgi:hypothetical protein
MMYRTVKVTAPGLPGSEYLFGQRGPSEQCDEEFLTVAIQNVCNQLASESYEVISIMPLVRGDLFGDSGVSFTHGAVITAKQISKS